MFKDGRKIDRKDCGTTNKEIVISDDYKLNEDIYRRSVTDLAKIVDDLAKSKELLSSYLEKIAKVIDKQDNDGQKHNKFQNPYHTFFEMMAVAAVVADINTGIIVDVNASACRLMGFERAQLIGLEHFMLHPAGERDKVRTDFKKTISNTYGVKRHIVEHADGHSISVEISASNSFEVAGHMFAVGIFKDVSANVLQEDEVRGIEEKNKKNDVIMKFFIDNLSHELRTPMNAIMGFTDIVLGTELHDEQVEYLNFVRGASEDLLGVIEKILNYSEIHSGDLKNKVSKASIVELIRKIILIYKDKIIEKDLACSCHYVHNFPIEIIADVDKIELILSTFVSNAIKFTNKGSMKIGLYTNGEKIVKNTQTFMPVKIVVEDTGIGIPEDKIDTIFDDFSQVDSSSTRAYGGMGLGLAIAKGYAEIIDGDIKVESKLGEGSIFTLEILIEVCNVDTLTSKKFDSLNDLLIVNVGYNN